MTRQELQRLFNAGLLRDVEDAIGVLENREDDFELRRSSGQLLCKIGRKLRDEKYEPLALIGGFGMSRQEMLRVHAWIPRAIAAYDEMVARTEADA